MASSMLGMILSLVVSSRHAQETNYGVVITEADTDSSFNF